MHDQVEVNVETACDICGKEHVFVFGLDIQAFFNQSCWGETEEQEEVLEAF